MKWSPYAPPRADYERGTFAQPPKSTLWIWLLAALGAVGSCFIGLMVLGAHVMAADIEQILRDDPAASARMGTVLDCSIFWRGEINDPRHDYAHYRCIGSDASGEAVVHTESVGPHGREELVDGVLNLDSGETIVLGQ